MHRSTARRTATDYFLVAGLIGVSGFPFFMVSQVYFFVLFLIAAWIYLKRSLVFDKRFMIIIGFFTSVELLQLLFLKSFDIILLSGTCVRLFLGAFVLSLAADRFTKYYTDIICFFAGLSFFFFLPSLVFPAFFHFCVSNICPLFESPFGSQNGFYTVWPTAIIFCFHSCVLDEFRNPGPFWEPGLFAVFLNLALLFHLVRVKKFWNPRSIILVVALLSTFSTAGYIAFFVLLFSYYIVDQSMLKKIVLSLFLLPALFTIYFSLDFLSAKVEQNITLAGSTTSSRFGSGLVDLNDFMESPVIGWGRGAMRYGGRPFTFFTEDQHRNNSVTEILATYGIFLFLFFFYTYFQSFKRVCLSHGMNSAFAYYALVVMLILGFSQSIFLRPFFYGLLFLRYTYTPGLTLAEVTERNSLTEPA